MTKYIKDGRFDIDILVRTVEGEIVALSHQLVMIPPPTKADGIAHLSDLRGR
ncbi:hypothetical protein F4776DRAFT_605465 [Hypoxylon sp. NC0597]|nr:hypothetical protein F4776DRAFT_605465 [Hypoxylon sp. NC0597]